MMVTSAARSDARMLSDGFARSILQQMPAAAGSFIKLIDHQCLPDSSFVDDAVQRRARCGAIQLPQRYVAPQRHHMYEKQQKSAVVDKYLPLARCLITAARQATTLGERHDRRTQTTSCKLPGDCYKISNIPCKQRPRSTNTNYIFRRYFNSMLPLPPGGVTYAVLQRSEWHPWETGRAIPSVTTPSPR